MAMSILQDWRRSLDVDAHRALLVTGIPEGLEQADVEAVLQSTLLPLGTFRLQHMKGLMNEKAQAALVEFVEDVNHAVIPTEIPGKDGIWRVLWKERAQDMTVLRPMRCLLLDDGPTQAMVAGTPGEAPTPPTSETPAQGLGQSSGRPVPFLGLQAIKESKEVPQESLDVKVKEADEGA
ncbi:paraneoplastic antigen-like protein 8B [Piliocolobus tephrosceles]|uniref:paraneoplastic antigen-like protein 8B n=1 Tax=Piliocolobus tephrosceles TaxID=591936 RepID=UPI000C29CEE5|nr:paraneoplastic antigen-like protein 8B [Piliocolobus tephrosceles]